MVRPAETRRHRWRRRRLGVGRRGVIALLAVLACEDAVKQRSQNPPVSGTPPQVVFVSQASDVWERATIYVLLKDNEGDRAMLRMQWAEPGGSFTAATPVYAQKLAQLPTSKAGRLAQFVWDSRVDVGDRNLTGVVLAASAADRNGNGAPTLSMGFAVRNKLRVEQVTAGDPGETITLQGRGFGIDASAVRVQFSGVAQPVVASDANGNIAHAVVPSGVIAGPLVVTIGTDASNPAVFAPRGKPVFAMGPPAPPGSSGVAPIAADVDGDGHVDLVQGAVLHNGGGGAFVAVESFPDATAVAGDLDGDGRCDLVTMPPGREGLILHQNSDGSFTARPFDAAAIGPKPAVALLDANGDGLPDLIALRATMAGAARLWLNVGGGSFAVRDDGALAAVPASDTLAVADYDGSGTSDLALGRADSVTLLSGSGLGSFALRASAFGRLGATAGLFAVAGDLDGDGLPDLITAGPFAWRRALASGGFVATAIQTAADPEAAVLADVNDDGRLDLYAVGAGHVRLYVSTADGLVEQAAAAGLMPPAHPAGALAADFDGDGRLDLYDGEHLLWNRTPVGNASVEVSLGGAWAGARAILTTPDGVRQFRWPVSSALPIHFGIGAFQSAQLEIDWADGKKTMRTVNAGDRLAITSS